MGFLPVMGLRWDMCSMLTGKYKWGHIVVFLFVFACKHSDHCHAGDNSSEGASEVPAWVSRWQSCDYCAINTGCGKFVQLWSQCEIWTFGDVGEYQCLPTVYYAVWNTLSIWLYSQCSTSECFHLQWLETASSMRLIWIHHVDETTATKTYKTSRWLKVPTAELTNMYSGIKTILGGSDG